MNYICGNLANTELINMNKYKFVGEKRTHEDIVHEGLSEESIVWIKQQGKPRGYIAYAMNLFEGGAKTIMLKAMGRAINKAVTIAEILKRKIPLCEFKYLIRFWDILNTNVYFV